MPKKIIGIDVRSASVKAACVSMEARGPILNKWAVSGITSNVQEDDPEKIKALALKDLLKANNMRAGKAIFVIGGPNVMVKTITLPPIPASEIKGAIQLQVEKMIPYPADEAVFDFYKLPVQASPLEEPQVEEHKEHTDAKKVVKNGKYLVAVVKRDVIYGVINMAKNAGVDLASVTAMPLALQAAFSSYIDDAATAIIYIGEYSMSIAVFVDKELMFNREIALGGDLIVQAMGGTVMSEKGKVELDRSAAEQLLITHGLPKDLNEYSERAQMPAEEISAMIRPALEKIEAEISRSFAFFGVKPEKMILTGGASRIKMLPEILSEDLKIPVEKIDPAAAISEKKDMDLSHLSAAVGAAIEGGRKINLLPEEIKHRPMVLLKRTVSDLRLQVCTAVVLAALIFISQTKISNSLGRQLQSVKAELALVTPQVQRLETLSQKLQGSGTFEQDRFIRILEELNNLVPANVWFQELDYSRTDNHLTITGIIKGPMSNFTDALKSSKTIKSVDLISFAPDETNPGTFTFSVGCGVTL